MSQKEEPARVIPKEITQLLERRATLGQWLGKLDELHETVRAEVHQRVRADYEERLRQKESELAAHRSEMETALEQHRTRVAALEADRDQKAAELEEAELRFAVGEFKEGEFKKRKGKHDEALADLDSELKSDRGALDELQDVVGVLASLGEGGVSAQPGGGVPWTRAEPADAEPVDEDQATDDGDGDTAETAEAEEPAETEAELIESDIEEESAEAREEKDEAPPKAAAETTEPEATEDYLDDLEFLESLSLDDIDRLDSVSAILAEEPDEGAEESPGRRA